MYEQNAVVVKASVCPLDCPDCCSLAVSVAADKVIAVRGSQANPYTAGAICKKVSRSYAEFVHGAARLTTPLQRTGGRGDGAYTPISWERALDLVYGGFSRAIDKYGPQSILPFNYAGPHGELAGGSMDRRFFYQMGASLLDRGPLCGGVRGSAYTSLYGPVAGMAPTQAVEADLVVVWGNNVTVSNLHLARVLKMVRQRGGQVIVIDPKRTTVASQADLYLQIQPGTDVVLAMAAAAELERRGALDKNFIAQWTSGFSPYMEEARRYTPQMVEQLCALPTAQFEQFINAYVVAKTVAVSVGNGIERGRSGGAGLRAAMALQALTGNHGRRGCGVLAKAGLITPKTTERLQRPDLIPAGTRTFNIVDVADKLLDSSLAPPIAATMIYNHNPVCTHPDQEKMMRALAREDLFVVGCDIVMTDSMQYADVILPAASHFEYDDIYGSYGQNYLQRAEPVIPRVGESLPNTEIFRRLAAKFGFTDAIFQDTDKQLINAAIDPTDRRLNGHRPSEIPTDQAIELQAPEGQPAILCDTLTPATASGKIELYSAQLEEQYGAGVPRYEPVVKDRPFVLISPSSSRRTNATFGHCQESIGVATVEMHSTDAQANGLTQGAMVSLSNQLGSVVLRLVITDDVKPGVLYSAKGTWLASSPTGRTVNVLINSKTRADLERGACYNETFVEVAAV